MAGTMDKSTFFQTAMELVMTVCREHDASWQVRRRKISTWMVFRFLHALIGELGVRGKLLEFELEKKTSRRLGDSKSAGENWMGRLSKDIGWSLYAFSPAAPKQVLVEREKSLCN